MVKNTTTYGEWLRNWVNIYKKPYFKSWKRIQANIRLHIPDYVKRCRLIDLSVIDIQKALNGVDSSRMRLEVYDIYHGSLGLAYDLGLLERDLTRLLIKPRHIRQVGSALTSCELTHLLACFSCHPLQSFYYFCVLTGARRSEALNLKWTDIDFNNRTVHLRGTKTDSADRVVPMFFDCYMLLQRLQRKGDKVFHHSPSYVSRMFSKHCPNHKLHDLRHTFATRCLECGISIKVVQGWLGHSRLDTTAMIYSHVMPEFERTEADKFSLFTKK